MCWLSSRPCKQQIGKCREGRLVVTDGPFAETREQIGGFFLIDAESEAEALDIAAGWPSARIGMIEVRPIEDELREEGRYIATVN